MMTTKSSYTFVCGTAVRLTFDPAPFSTGTLARIERVRDRDNMKFWVVEFTDRDDERTEQIVPESALVAVCEYVHRFIDFDGSWADMPCGFDAARTLVMTSRHAPDPSPFNVCATHADEIRREPGEERITLDQPV